MKAILFNKINISAICLLAFAIPLFPKLIPLAITITALTCFLNGNYKNLKNKSKNVLVIIPLFCFYLISLLYSENLQFGLKDLETKLSLLVLPISFFISKIDLKSHLQLILKWFVIGVFIAIIICFSDAIYQFILTKEESELFYAKLSMFMHPGYFSMYVNFALIICLFNVFTPRNNQALTKKVNAFGCLIFIPFIVLLSSKIGIITMFLSCLIAAIYWIKIKKAYIKSIVGLIVISLALVTTYNLSYSFKVRIDELFNTVSAKNTSTESTSAVRLLAWQTSVELISKKPIMGYGIGDTKDILLQAYQNKGLTTLSEKKLNPHNQFLQISLAIGILGCLIFILILYHSISKSIRHNCYLCLAFVSLFIINLLTECMLERIVGVVFFALFYSLFMVSIPLKINDTQK